jgi:hypothetical protein
MGVRATPRAGDNPEDTLADALSAKRETYRRNANEFKTPSDETAARCGYSSPSNSEQKWEARRRALADDAAAEYVSATRRDGVARADGRQGWPFAWVTWSPQVLRSKRELGMVRRGRR